MDPQLIYTQDGSTLKEMTIKKRIALSFGILILLLIVIGGMNFSGLSRILTSIDDATDSNRLKILFAEREIDHLNWASHVSNLLTDDKVTVLDVETDHTRCGLGKWLYGPKRDAAVKLVPGIASLLKSIEEPHRQLHETSRRIKNTFKQADISLPSIFSGIESAHVAWAEKVSRGLLLQASPIKVQTDPVVCKLGKWLVTPEAKKLYVEGDAEYRQFIESIDAPHR